MNKPTAVIDKSLLQAICEQAGDKRDLCFNTLLGRYILVVPEILVEEVWANLANPSAGKSLATINMMVRCLLHLRNEWIAEPLEIAFVELVKGDPLEILPKPDSFIMNSFFCLDPRDAALKKWFSERKELHKKIIYKRIAEHARTLKADKFASIKSEWEFFEKFIRPKFAEALEAMAERCIACDKNLAGHPRIRFDGEVYCYHCAKGVVGEQDWVAEQQLAPKLKEYESQVARYETWQNNFKAASPSKGTQGFIVVGVAVGFAYFVGEGKETGDIVFLFLCGLVIGLVVNLFYVDRKQGEWTRRNPKPAYPSRPSGDFASNRIELVGGGTKGRQIAGSYRKQILERDGYKCQNCGNVLPADQLEVHHIKSRAKRGKNLSTNLITLCFDCHLDEDWFGHSHYMRKWFRRRP
jgi:5-methylcytosine-specific restriction endonuclease McrA